MPPLAVETGLVSRIMGQREVMISLTGLALVLLTLLLGRVNAAVILLTANNESLSFPDMEASFGPRVPLEGIIGILHAASPLDACIPLLNVPAPQRELLPPFLLVSRGVCNFDAKVLHAQNAGFEAVVIFNNVDDHELVTMSGNSENIHIHAVFVSRLSGEALLGSVSEVGTKCYIMQASGNFVWSVMAVAFISLLAVSAVLSTYFFVRRHRLRRLGSRLMMAREPLGMSSKEVKALPSFLFKRVGDGNGTAETCVICLEDYETGEKLRLLPCRHEFHVTCIDQWLMTRRPFCPVCKRDAHSKSAEPVATESTPLLAAVGIAIGSSIPAIVTSIASTQTSPEGSPTNHQLPSQSPDLHASFSWQERGSNLC